jgi:hypothetical protein
VEQHGINFTHARPQDLDAGIEAKRAEFVAACAAATQQQQQKQQHPGTAPALPWPPPNTFFMQCLCDAAQDEGVSGAKALLKGLSSSKQQHTARVAVIEPLLQAGQPLAVMLDVYSHAVQAYRVAALLGQGQTMPYLALERSFAAIAAGWMWQFECQQGDGHWGEVCQAMCYLEKLYFVPWTVGEGRGGCRELQE